MLNVVPYYIHLFCLVCGELKTTEESTYKSEEVFTNYNKWRLLYEALFHKTLARSLLYICTLYDDVRYTEVFLWRSVFLVIVKVLLA